MPGAGYLIATPQGITGTPGDFFDYVMGSNGLFMSARNAHLGALINISNADIRGLCAIEEKVTLVHGKIPRRFYELALSACLIRPIKERYIAVTWEGGEYHVEYPEQQGSAGGVIYERPANVVLDIHSHGGMNAFFSGTDTKDEQGFNLSLVIGKVETVPEYKLRLCCYGYYYYMAFEEVFDECNGTLTTVSPTEEPATPGLATSWGLAAQEDGSRRGAPAFFRRVSRWFSSIWTGSRKEISSDKTSTPETSEKLNPPRSQNA